MVSWFKSNRETSRLSREGDISKKDIEKFRNDLNNKWKIEFQKGYIEVEPTEEHDDRELELKGQSIFHNTIEYKGKIAGIEPGAVYFSKGHYHDLANKLEIGWHPEWDKIFSNSNNNENNK